MRFIRTTSSTHRRPAHACGDAEHGDERHVEATEGSRRLLSEEGLAQDGIWRECVNEKLKIYVTLDLHPDM
jgi:hypothetical protein